MTTPDQPTPEAVLALAATTFGDALMRQLNPGQALLLAVDAVWSVAAEAADKTALGERERGVAEGRCQATEGWGREWGLSLHGHPAQCVLNEHAARGIAADPTAPADTKVLSRLVGPWEATEQGDGGPR